MLDAEYRIMMSGEHGVEQVGIFYINVDGQVSLVDAWEVAPFDTKRQLIEDVLRRIVRHKDSIHGRW